MQWESPPGIMQWDFNILVLTIRHALQWAYADSYSTYTGVAWRIKRVGSSTVDTSGTITRADAITAAVTSPLTATIDLKYNSGEKSGEALRGRFTVELCMANDQVTCTDASSWTPASDAFAAGGLLLTTL